MCIIVDDFRISKTIGVRSHGTGKLDVEALGELSQIIAIDEDGKRLTGLAWSERYGPLRELKIQAATATGVVSLE